MKTIQIDQSGTTPALPTIGAQLAPLFTWRGQDVYPVWGSEGDDDGGGDPDSGPDDDDNDDDTGTGEGGGTDSDTVSRKDLDEVINRMKAADKRASAAEAALKKIEDGKKDELTKATERAKELEEQIKSRDTELAEMRLQNAFLTADTGVTWYDPGDALALAERKGYLAEVVDEDGKVDGSKLAAKLKEFASKHKHMVKSGEGEESNPRRTKEETRAATGGKVGSKGGKKNDGEPDLSRYDRILNR